MDFSFSDEQKLIADTVRAFAAKELLPKYAYWDRHDEFPRVQWLQMGELGLLGLRVMPEHGGQNHDGVTAGIVMEEIARGDFNCGYGLLLCCFTGDILEKFATSSVKDSWLPPMARGEKVICTALTEPHCGSDASAIRTRAVRTQRGYVLNGEKSAITLLMVGAAAVVFAKTDPSAGAKGISAFLVPLDRPGISRHPYSDLGARGIVRGSLFLDGVEIPHDHLIGKEGEGFTQVMQAFDLTRALIGLMCLGAAQVTVEETVDYLKRRSAFGKALSSYQGVTFPLAEAAAKLQMARWLCYRTLWLRDQGLPHTMEAAMCKMQAPEISTAVIHECLILHGHYGYTKDFAVEQRLRDVIGQEIADGTPQIQKIIVARHLFGRDTKGL
jgi:cyclohexanecarboxyl-CoA dehydrogenase